MSLQLDISRHRSVFDPQSWGMKPVHVIGVGATGSKVALSLSKLGVKNLHVWDADVVEEHNLANQAYVASHLGKNKAEAMVEIWGGIAPAEAGSSRMDCHPRFWEPQDAPTLGGVVFTMADTMLLRRQVFDAVKRSFNVELVIDSRMGSYHGQLLSYRPGRSSSLKAYEATLFSDDDAQVEVSACGTAITVGPTADIISGYAVWMFINHANALAVPGELAVNAREPYVGTVEV